MKPIRSKYRLLNFLLPIFLYGCFTDTGNPEENDYSVSAEFSIDYAFTEEAENPPVARENTDVDEIIFSRMSLKLYDAELETEKGDIPLYGDSATEFRPRWVDFTANDTLLWIPDSMLYVGDWRLFHFNFSVAAAPHLSLDTLDYSRFSDLAYIKGEVKTDSRSIRFLFEMPKAKKLSLYFRDSSLVKFQARSTHCEIVVKFHAHTLFDGVGLDSLPPSCDKQGVPFLLLTRKAHGALWKQMQHNFYRAFEVDSVAVEGKTPP